MVICAGLFAQQAADEANSPFRMPDSIRNVIDNAPEIFLLGVGYAKTESDGEAILLSESRARLKIAQQIASIVFNYASESELTIMRSKADLHGSFVVKREKSPDGVWWTVVFANKNINRVTQLYPYTDTNTILFNAANALWFDILKISIDKVIPDWILTPPDAENMVYGLGAAKLDNDEDSLQLAKERARSSLARSIHTGILFSSYTLDVNNTEYYEECVSFTSVCDNILIRTELINLAKTEDGTWWVMLGCSVFYIDTPVRASEEELELRRIEMKRITDEEFERFFKSTE